jgi:hypothetical protein
MSIRFFLRGAFLLPFFFMHYTLSASSIEGYFNVFYSDLNHYDQWLKEDMKDYFKDIFISAFNLPSSNNRKFRHDAQFKIINSYTNDEDYAYVYLDFKTRTSVELIVSGVEKGELNVNGAKRGEISVENDSDYTHISAVFEKGVYFVSIKINKRFNNIPVVALSNRQLSLSKRRGFNRTASANIRVANLKGTLVPGIYSSLFKSFCFPYFKNNDDKRDLFFSVLNKNEESMEGFTLLGALFKSVKENETVSKLTNKGFSIENLSWWKDKILKNEVCRYGENQP